MRNYQDFTRKYCSGHKKQILFSSYVGWDIIQQWTVVMDEFKKELISTGIKIYMR